MPSTTLSFALKDTFLQHVFPQFDPTEEPTQYMATRIAAGGIAGVLALALVYPMDFATIRMAANVGPRDASESWSGGLPSMSVILLPPYCL